MATTGGSTTTTTTTTTAPLEHVCLPINLDAFVLNSAVCDKGASFITPIVQPNYVSLRLDNSQIQHDILPRIDLLNAKPALANPRVSKTWSAPLRPLDPKNPAPAPSDLSGLDRSRLGVYIHWTIPRGYRSAAAQAAKPSESATSKDKADGTTNQNPVFPLVPNRWLIVRVLRDWEPKTAAPEVAASWVIESDKLRKIDSLDDSVDLLTDVTPFVAYSGGVDTNEDILNNQAEIYIGQKTPLSRWTETNSKDDRVPLSVMNSSNPLFADYAIHNPNVFSTKDNFQYGVDKDNQPLYLTNATCDYAVFGWHSDASDDPLDSSKNVVSKSQLITRLKNFSLMSQPNSDGKASIESTDKNNIDRQKNQGDTRLICHATRYDVVFDLNQKPAAPADDYAKLFNPDVPMEPVSVGTSPLDAVLAFLQAHQDDTTFEDTLFRDDTSPDLSKTDPSKTDSSKTDPSKTDSSKTDPSKTDSSEMDPGKTAKRAPSAVAQALMGMRELLYSTEDDYDAKVKAADLIYAHNFGGAPGGFAWHYDKKKDKDGPPIEPGNDEKQQLSALNEQQRLWDANDGQLRQLRWALFSEFFKYVSDPSNTSQDTTDRTAVDRFQLYKTRVPSLRGEIQNLMDQQTTLEGLMRNRTVPARKIANDAFYRRTDPTLCLAGIDGGWDPEFLQNTPTRFFLDGGLIQGPGSKDTRLFKTALDLVKRLPTEIVPTISGLLKESSGGYQPALSRYGHKEWSGQPFSPQFIEWEGIYYHLAWNQWKVDLAKSALTSSNHTQVTYINNKQLSTQPGITDDIRHISGRMLVLPQPSFALGAVVSQVLDTIPVDPDAKPTTDPTVAYNLSSQEDRDSLLAAVKRLRFISGELSGITDALLTMAAGQHVKPNLRVQGGDPVPMQAAVKAGTNISLTSDDFVKMGAETGRTPYGTMTDFTGAKQNPFKPVQHGQFAITKLTIVDKFGQAISYPPPKRTLRDNPQATLDVASYVHPCIDEQLLPSLFNNTLNTVYTPQDTRDKIAQTSSGYPMTPFIQLTPALNQEARINAVFLEKVTNTDKSKSWSPCSDWENPIFGWVVVNYADSSLQFFTGEGIFYTSLEFGGPTGTIKTKDWLPFDPPDQAEAIVADQLDTLIKRLRKPGEDGKRYLLALWDLIRRAIPTMPFPPSDYAQYANAIVGKPLALVNVGWSIELAQPPYWQQHTLSTPPIQIVPDKQPDPLRAAAEDYLTKTYQFPVKIGDADRPFDGVVAYWDSKNPVPDPKSSIPATDFELIHTYFPADQDDGLRENIVPEKYPKLTPYFNHPDPVNNPKGAGFAKSHTDQLTVKTILIDPYTPIHLYSGILPIKKLELPAWTLRGAMKNMTAFFTMGPLLITKDVPKLYDLTKQLHPDSWLVNQTKDNKAATNTQPAINLPVSGSKGMWNWLQPYRTDKQPVQETTAPNGKTGVITVPQGVVTRYNSLEVGKEDGRMRMDPGPYTFVEGFLQLARPIVPPKGNSSTVVTAPAVSSK